MAYEYDRLEREDGGGSFLMGLLAGTVLGAGLGMLFAPKTGSELRNQIGEQAGRIDGASLMGLYRYIIFPLSAPSFAVVIIWQFTQAWNEFLFAVILTNQAHWPVTVALNNLAGSQLVQWNVLMAATLLAALPTLLVYIFLGRFFLRGLMAGALKG